MLNDILISSQPTGFMRFRVHQLSISVEAVSHSREYLGEVFTKSKVIDVLTETKVVLLKQGCPYEVSGDRVVSPVAKVEPLRMSSICI